MHTVSTLANDDYLKLEKVLNENVQECFAYLDYVIAKANAEEAEYEFQMKMNNRKKNI